MACIKLLLQLIKFDYYFSLIRMKTRLQFLSNANNSEKLENNGRLDIIRITYIHSLGGGLIRPHTVYVQLSVAT